MNSATIAEGSLSAFTLHPVEKRPNTFVIRFKRSPSRRTASKHPKGRLHEMTDEDWDKFEKDIVDAFERVP
jgi:hypothetical protein